MKLLKVFISFFLFNSALFAQQSLTVKIFSPQNGTTGKTDSTAVVSSRNPQAGILFYASYLYKDNVAAISNPHIIGAFFQIYWSEIETSDSVYDWHALEAQMKPWLNAGKKIALRIMWSSSGYWPDPSAKKPTPQWVWNRGAKFAFHSQSNTEIPLIWDPIYQRYAIRFMKEAARKFDADTTILFLDVTPGAETNTYRFGTIDQQDPGFRQTFLSTVASDGRVFDDNLWVATVQSYIDSSAVIFRKLPLLVTLNRGGMPDGPNRLIDFGTYATARKFYVGQNGLKGSSYLTNSESKSAFLNWAAKTKLFFEMVAATGGSTGTLMEVMQAALRIQCSYLNVYAIDVLRGTVGHSSYDPEYESALQFGAAALSGVTTDIENGDDKRAMPIVFELHQNYPNPFNPETTIEYAIPSTEKGEMIKVTLKVYDVLGREVATLVDEYKRPGKYSSTFYALRSTLSSGVYFYQLVAGKFYQVRKAVLIR
jgi:hypothetical protein